MISHVYDWQPRDCRINLQNSTIGNITYIEIVAYQYNEINEIRSDKKKIRKLSEKKKRLSFFRN